MSKKRLTSSEAIALATAETFQRKAARQQEREEARLAAEAANYAQKRAINAHVQGVE